MLKRNRIFKVGLIGDASTGKTAFLQRYLTGQFIEDTRTTLGVNFCTKTLEVEGEIITLQFWDFGGNERFRFLVSSYCNEIDAILFIYDITNSASINKLEGSLKKFHAGNGKTIFLIIGNKKDLNFRRQLQLSDVISHFRTLGTKEFFEVSSKTGENVNIVFETIIKLLLNHQKQGFISPLSTNRELMRI